MPKFILPNNPVPQIGLPPGLQLDIPNHRIGKFSGGLKRAVNFCADYGGCGFWRMLWPEYMINIYQKGLVSSGIAMILDPRYYTDVKSVRVQRQATENQVQFLKHLKGISKNNGMKLLYEVDDVIFRNDIPMYNGCRHAFDKPEVEKYSIEAIMLCDKVTVVSEYMRDYYARVTGHSNVSYIPNYMPKFWFDRFYSKEKIETRYNKYRRKPRIGVFASSTHIDVRNQNNNVDDFTHVNDAIIKTCKDIKWVLMGGKPRKLINYINSGLIEYHPWVNLNDYPTLMDKVDINMSFAPLMDNEFNRSKSDIKITEAGALGIPCVCQNMITYKDALLKFNKGDDLIDIIVSTMKDENKYFDLSAKSRKFAETRWLEDHIDEYLELYCLN